MSTSPGPGRPRFALHPGGAVRTALAPDGRARDLFRQLAAGATRSDLGDEGLYLAEELLAADPFLDDNHREALGYLVLALLTATAQGATRLALDPRGPLRELVALLAKASGSRVTADAVAKVLTTLTGGHFSTVLGVPGQRRPLIIDDGQLYLERDHQREQRVARAIASRLVPAKVATADVDTAIADLHARPAGAPLTDEQAAAVRAALAQRMTVIVGGPGTGKTALAVAIVRGLARTGAVEIALAAPTGRAAHRLGVAVGAALTQLAADASVAPIDAALAATPPAPVTLHRLLGARDQGFRHGAHAPLHVDAVLVDEASMIDLRLLDGLLAALPPQARLILLGDADQLPSVDAGQALADLVAVGTNTVRLTRSFRMDPTDPDGLAVLTAARAVQAGDTAALLAGKARLLRKADLDEVATTPHGASLLEVTDDAGRRALLDATFARLATAGYRAAIAREHRFDPVTGFAPAAAAAIHELLAALDGSRILAVTRGQPTGALALSAYLHERLVATSLHLDGQPELVPGEPVMMTANDHARGLWNGDQGVIVRVAEPGGGQRWRAVFARAGQLVPFPIDALRSNLERAWAITVHKSQGSEFDDVTLILPDDDVAILTRELIYTAMTRARRGVRVVGSRAVFNLAVGRRATRDSGLAARIVAAQRPACDHDVVLNGACLACGTTDLDPIEMSPKPAQVIAAEALVRRKK